MTEAEKMLIEASLNWRRIHGPARLGATSSAMTDVATWAEAVIRERNATARDDSIPNDPYLQTR